MNIRADHTNLTEIVQTNSKVEIKGNATVQTQETTTRQVEEDTGRVSSVQQTKVDVPLISGSGESQLDKIKQEARQQEAEHFKKQMEVVTNTASEKDCGEMEKDGFPLNGTDVETIVTEMDKIKMELAKAGIDISMFGDTLSMEELERMTGSVSMANQIESAIKQADFPATEQNISDCTETMEQAASLTECNKETIKYMVENELPPTVENLYMAQHSTSAGVPGSNNSGIEMDDHLKSQVEQVITQAGLPVDDTTLTYSQWMLDNEIPLTAENLKYTADLSNMQLPPDAGQVMGAMLEAMAEGGRPKDAILIDGYSNADRAVAAEQVVSQATDADVWSVVEKGLPLTIQNLEASRYAAEKQEENASGKQQTQAMQNIPDYAREDIGFLTAKRQLEETRLMMTVQANYALLKQGISIETKPLEEVVEQLKSIENDYYKSLLSQNGVPETEENTAVFAETMGKTQELTEVPAYVLGNVKTDEDTINTIHEAGISEQAKLERAGEAYETLMTSPRADMGDSIQKAFRNVDDILADLDLEITEANQRAVRILAYNELEITPESIAQMKAADQKVQNLFHNLSPSVVMEMIRDGVNPLEMNVEQLNAKAEEIKERLSIDGEEKFSKYLWKLEQNQEITKQERDSYIGIYRLLHQVSKTDGAVIGALVNQGAELTMKNLLTALRTNRNSGIDVSVDNNFGEADTVQTQGLSISQQIESAYQTDCAKEAFEMATPEGIQQAAAQGAVEEMTPEQLLWQLKQAEVDADSEESYYQEQLQEFSQAKAVETQIIQILNGYDMPVTAYNIMAATQAMNNRNGVFKTLFDNMDTDGEINFEEVKEEILKEFGEAVKTPDDMAKAQEKLADVAENVMKTMIQSEDVRSTDIRDMRIMCQQIELGSRMAKEENYAVPVLVADEMMNVQLKIVRGKRERGRVDVMFESPKFGKVAANFHVRQGSIKAYVVSDSVQTIEELKQREDTIKNHMNPDGESQWSMDAVYSNHLDLAHLAFGETSSNADGEQSEEEYQVQTKILYGVAKAFIEEVKTMG